MERKKTPRKNFNGLIVILGPTSSGKTSLSIKLAKKFEGEVVSADSRQVYKGMDIGSGKVTKKEMAGIPHHLLDVASPRQRFTVAQYQKLALKAIRNIQNRGKIPFLVGGTGFYIQSVVDGIAIPEVKPDWKLREKLSLRPLSELVKQLAKLDPNRSGIIDQNNPRRVVRALEIAIKLGAVPPAFRPDGYPATAGKQTFETLFIGLKKSPEELKKAIHERLLARMKNNAIINEVKKLRKTLSWKRLEEFGLEYRFIAQYLQGKTSYQEMISKIETESWHLVKKQMTWFKRDKRICWVKDFAQAEKLIKKFL